MPNNTAGPPWAQHLFVIAAVLTAVAVILRYLIRGAMFVHTPMKRLSGFLDTWPELLATIQTHEDRIVALEDAIPEATTNPHRHPTGHHGVDLRHPRMALHDGNPGGVH